MTVPALGLDLSLTATGIALPDGTTRTIRPRTVGVERLTEICDRIAMRLATPPAPLVAVVETPFVSAKFMATGMRLAELGGVVRVMLYRSRVPFLDVAPAALKKWATGDGNASKDKMITAARAHGADVADDNQADAWWLWALAQARYDAPGDWPPLGPLAALPWPAITGAAA